MSDVEDVYPADLMRMLGSGLPWMLSVLCLGGRPYASTFPPTRLDRIGFLHARCPCDSLV